MLQAEHQDIHEISQLIPDSEYYSLQHFLSDSPWSSCQLKEQVAERIDNQLAGDRDRIIYIDEVATPKKGDKSVGVGRQYCGNRGKTENCQVQVAAYMSDLRQGSFIDQRLYLPADWCNDPERLKKAGLQADTPYQSKLTLAIDMMDSQIRMGRNFQWIGGDGFYGRDLNLIKAVEKRGKKYLFEIDKDRRVYLENCRVEVPARKSKKGPQPFKKRPIGTNIRVDQYARQLTDKDFNKIRVRDSFKGNLTVQAHVVNIWFWDAEEEALVASRLLIRKDGNRIKYAITNAFHEELQQIVRIQAGRYFIERGFQEAKNVLGMKFYQVRKYRALQHFMALIFLLLLFLMEERKQWKELNEMVSYRDIKNCLQFMLPAKTNTWEGLAEMILLNLVEKYIDYIRNLSK